MLSSMCTEPHPAARRAAERFLATNPGDPASYPAVADLETQAIEYLGEIAGLETPDGYVASGGTEANIQAVRAARNLARDGTSADGESVNVVAPESAHFSFHKAAGLLDVELRLVPTEDGKADLTAVEAAVDEGTALVVGIAGTTEYGRVDPIGELAELARSVGARTHIDAAWGGFLLPFSDHEWTFADAPIDSMTIDPHKVGRAAIPAGGFLVRDRALLDALAVETPYLESASQASLTGTRSGAGVASTVAACEALWPAGYRENYERARANAEWLAGELSERGFPVVEPELPIVAADLPQDLFETLREAGWRISRTGRGELRVVCMPHVTRGTLGRFLADLDSYR
ncbi:L-tyrosine decarboxylase [Halalkalicoccus jeotgali B3]|uniref:L-tyrosine decarboxylase n=1 Tax=Halalkalicoccus jeotgali (strain DSM 18796 / CECT 7217 / JCM 14584 / KCTC 4019 / B3) TaxID=795797 RepID=D8J7I6_HALJB|nr:L-tyrosine decarboxylase [Halalkalicoccus jeotgali B3]ELY38102.1 L-tyrosine decarboxylase [Halalkalicoccus jeotgali B3]